MTWLLFSSSHVALHNTSWQLEMTQLYSAHHLGVSNGFPIKDIMLMCLWSRWGMCSTLLVVYSAFIVSTLPFKLNPD